ncbi:MarR family winged helix-turn-helix transcriptional regulator [Xanthobacter autotrophicus]|uniref:MarR family winged helix-turn-helix transcriptional regulator n=1 Tax=Xanthobacter autotrophicus TaxID=280 RepID=UPI0024A67285|nr:MarR family transcriptional regulator [Xanthobacter autotrophicus]MDI4654957.1 MarR family transcriptional regulator [Xanthobacter autotrophicus]
MSKRKVERLNLLKFMPFRLNRLAAEFSTALAVEYMARFGIDIPEWRVLATLGLYDTPRSAQYVVRCTRTHKSRISRAVGSLVALGYVARAEAIDDRREVMLELTPKGRAVYGELVPLLLKREEAILSCLSAEERAQLDHLMDKLEQSFDLVQCED